MPMAEPVDHRCRQPRNQPGSVSRRIPVPTVADSNCHSLKNQILKALTAALCRALESSGHLHAGSSVSGLQLYRQMDARQELNCNRHPGIQAQLSATILLFSGCAKNVIPERRAHAVTSMIVIIMMTQMVLLEPKPHPSLHGEVMDRVMDRIVANIAKSKSRRDGWREPAQGNGKERPK